MVFQGDEENMLRVIGAGPTRKGDQHRHLYCKKTRPHKSDSRQATTTYLNNATRR